jgi:acylphosphatase
MVQGVYFRAYTQNYAKSLNLRGWVQNTHSSTVIGIAEGERIPIDQFKYWLRNTGSPQSRIDDVKFEESKINEYSFQDFRIKH